MWGIQVEAYKQWLSGLFSLVSVEFSCSVVSDSLQPLGLQHTRAPCPSPTPRLYTNSCPLSWWCRPTISSSVVPFSSGPQSFPASRSFQMSQLFTSGGPNIEVSASTSVFPMNTQDWFSLGWTGWISLQSKGLSRVISNTIVQKHWLGTRVHPWWIHVDVWQNQYNIVKWKKKLKSFTLKRKKNTPQLIQFNNDDKKLN